MADALSRMPPQQASQYSSLAQVLPDWLAEVIKSYENDPLAAELFPQLMLSSSGTPNYSYSQ